MNSNNNRAPIQTGIFAIIIGVGVVSILVNWSRTAMPMWYPIIAVVPILIAKEVESFVLSSSLLPPLARSLRLGLYSLIVGAFVWVPVHSSLDLGVVIALFVLKVASTASILSCVGLAFENRATELKRLKT